MSWKEILKKVSMDMQEGNKACCEVARGEIMEVYQNSIERYKQEGRLDRVKSMEHNMRMVEELDCKELKEQIKIQEDKMEGNPPKGMKFNPSLIRFKEILEDWDECESDAEKVKEGLKEKPEGFNPEEPYARQKDWWKGEKPVRWSK